VTRTVKLDLPNRSKHVYAKSELCSVSFYHSKHRYNLRSGFPEPFQLVVHLPRGYQPILTVLKRATQYYQSRSLTSQQWSDGHDVLINCAGASTGMGERIVAVTRTTLPLSLWLTRYSWKPQSPQALQARRRKDCHEKTTKHFRLDLVGRPIAFFLVVRKATRKPVTTTPPTAPVGPLQALGPRDC
jgi:hypothetical protein